MTERLDLSIPGHDREAHVVRLARLLATYLPGKRLRIRVGEEKRKRTDRQNAALFGVAYAALSRQTGNDPADLHAYFCGEYFGWTTRAVFDQQRRVPRRTTTTDENGQRDVLPVDQFSEFYDFIVRRSAEAGYIVPDPDPEWRNAA